MNVPMIDGPRHPPKNNSQPKNLVILLHGYGADGNDLIGLAPYFSRILPDAYFVSPHAPERCEMSPTGYQWFPISQFDKSNRLTGTQGAAPILNQFIDQELDRNNLNEKDLVLIGFSQGTMMALHVAPRRSNVIAGVLGFSGLLAGPELLADETVSRPPIMLIHGDADEMLPVQNLHQAVQALGAAEFAVEWHISQGAGHTIAPDGLELGMHFLRNIFSQVNSREKS